MRSEFSLEGGAPAAEQGCWRRLDMCVICRRCLSLSALGAAGLLPLNTKTAGTSILSKAPLTPQKAGWPGSRWMGGGGAPCGELVIWNPPGWDAVNWACRSKGGQAAMWHRALNARRPCS